MTPAASPPAKQSRRIIDDATGMGPVELLVSDLELMTRYYRDAVALEPLNEHDGAVTLGRGTEASLILRRARDLPVAARGQAGLFHAAIVFESHSALAASLARVAHAAPGTFTGSADHLFSEAFYFTDPEGNGLELYHDRPREQWQYDDDGSFRVASLPLDPNGFLREHLTEEALASSAAAGAAVGHVHLQVGDIATAKQFYAGVLGFDVTIEMDTALFVSAGGYHHHIGMNTWHSAGAGPRAASLGLGQLNITVPNRDEIGAMVDRLGHHGTAVADDGRTLHFVDPWNTRIQVTAVGN